MLYFQREKLLFFTEVYLTGKDRKCTFFKKITTLSFPCYIYKVGIKKKILFPEKKLIIIQCFAQTATTIECDDHFKNIY